jgi:uncharacterized membrane-anchored protein
MALREPDLDAVVGLARVDRRTKNLVRRLLPGDIAVIDHEDLDRVAVESLLQSGVAAVVNAAVSVSGRYPNAGPLELVTAGVVLVDGVGPEVLDRVSDGDVITIEHGEVIVGGEIVATGQRQTSVQLGEQLDLARQSVGEALSQFASNTMEWVRREHELVTDQPAVPDIDVEFSGRHALVVVRGVDHRDDLAALKRSGYLREVKPVLIGVDGGADALVEMGLAPDVIIGDFDSVSESTLRCGAALVVHASPAGRAPGAARLAAMGLAYTTFPSAGTSEDVAMLLAHQRGAELIVAVGSHTSLEEFLDKGRPGMASTFLVRLRVGDILVDAKGVSRLYRPVVRSVDIAVLVLSMIGALVAVTLMSKPIQLWLRSLWLLVRSAVGH